MTSYDLVLRSGTVVDGSGRPARTADVAIRDGVIVEVGRVVGQGKREVDADGAIVAPGFVDIHTHYDGQATWDERLQPSSSHGVTTVVMGNCGVGFAPVRSSHHEQLIELMEGVEDIPGSVLHEGLPWTPVLPTSSRISRPADSACTNRPPAICTRSSAVSRSTRTANRPARFPAAWCAAPAHLRPRRDRPAHRSSLRVAAENHAEWRTSRPGEDNP